MSCFPYPCCCTSTYHSPSALIQLPFVMCCFVFQTLIKDPTLSSIVMNPHVKRSIKQKTFGDALTKAKVSPMTINLISEWSVTRLSFLIAATYLVCLSTWHNPNCSQVDHSRLYECLVYMWVQCVHTHHHKTKIS